MGRPLGKRQHQHQNLVTLTINWEKKFIEMMRTRGEKGTRGTDEQGRFLLERLKGRAKSSKKQALGVE